MVAGRLSSIGLFSRGVGSVVGTVAIRGTVGRCMSSIGQCVVVA